MTTHGGARPKQRPDDKRSNNSRMVRRIRLSEESAKTCRILGYRSQEQIERFVDELVASLRRNGFPPRR